MGGKIDAYIDCSSPYSYFAVVYLRRQRRLLEQYGIEIEFHPVFLGGINHITGNKPPGTLPAKAAHSPHDLRRACAFYSTPPITPPPFFPLNSILPQRTMLAIKSRHPREKFETIYEDLWVAVFSSHVDIARQEELAGVLGRHLREEEVRVVMEMAGTKEVKGQLTANTTVAVEKGAFGAPWFWLRNDDTGREEPMFGSDRWAYMFGFLGVEVEELRIVDRQKGSGKARL